MIVSEIYSDLVRATGLLPEDANLRYATEAVEILSNKGDFDISLQYLTMNVPAGQNVLTMPPTVDTVLKVNIDGTPAFSRDRLYEFTLNGPGSNTERIDFTWEQRGTVAIQNPLPVTAATPELKPYTVSDALDNGKTLSIEGTNAAGNKISETVTLNASPPTFANYYATITSVRKDVTLRPVSLRTLPLVAVPDSHISNYAENETEPRYRQIRVSKTGGVAYILFKLQNFKITSLNQFIPIKSKRALIEMIKALRKYDSGGYDEGAKIEAVAVKWAMEEQEKTNSFIKLAAATEVQSIRGLNTANRDSLIVADVFDDLDRIFGKIGTPKLYDKLTEVLEVLHNKGQFDALTGWVDIRTDQYHYLTLPRYVDAVQAINICNQPTDFKNSWFEFHLNGPGGWASCCDQPREAGEVVTFRDVNYSQKLVAIPDLSSDINTVMRGYGRYQGKEIFTAHPTTGVLEKGFPIDVNMSGATSSNQFVDAIERITKAPSNGFIKLLGFDSSRNVQNTIGYYWPDETEPKYRRIWIPTTSTTVRLKYRKRTLKISALTDPLHTNSKTAVVRGMMMLKAMDEKDYQGAAIEEAAALRFLEEEQKSQHPADLPELEIAGQGWGSNFVV